MAATRTVSAETSTGTDADGLPFAAAAEARSISGCSPHDREKIHQAYFTMHMSTLPVWAAAVKRLPKKRWTLLRIRNSSSRRTGASAKVKSGGPRSREEGKEGRSSRQAGAISQREGETKIQKRVREQG